LPGEFAVQHCLGMFDDLIVKKSVPSLIP